MKKSICLSVLVFFVLSVLRLSAQNPNAVLVTIGDDSVTIGEFISSYQKNNQLSNSTAEEIREYLDLYINFKLKVKEGKSLQIDTGRAFKAELASYKNQSAQQYLIDKDVSDHLVQEALDRMKYNIRASHILIECPYTASPKDTLTAYNKAIGIRNSVLNGMNFAEAAVKYSDDKSARDTVNPTTQKKQYGNKGDLGYFTVFNLIYPFESGAYNTPVGSVSMPVRTQFGYHLIYVYDKIPAVEFIKASQIFISDSLAAQREMSEETRAKIEKIKAALKGGETFEKVVKEYSEDRVSREKDGALEPFSPGRRAGDYVQALVSLRPGGISEPVPSTIGWHILRLDELVPVVVNDEAMYLLRSRIARDTRSHLSKQSLVEKLKKEYRYEEKGKRNAMKFFEKKLPSTYFQSTAVNIEELPGIDKLKPMFTFADQQVTAKEFGRYLARFQGVNVEGPLNRFLEDRFTIFVEDKILAYENSRLETKYPEFKELVREYHDGMILYEINSNRVWGKALKDSAGLENYYQKIKFNYPAAERDSATYKSFEEIRAIVITEYQDYLDKEWVKELKARYPVKIDEELFSTLLKR